MISNDIYIKYNKLNLIYIGNVNVIGAKEQRKINKNELIKENIQSCSKKMTNKDSRKQKLFKIIEKLQITVR